MGEFDLLVNTDCLECSDDFGPPPDDILQIPPPPLPYFLRPETNNETAQCSNQCAWAPHYPGVEYIEFSHHGSTSDDTWFFLVVALCVGVLLLGGLLTLLLLKFRSKISNKSSIQVASTIVKSKNCESVLYPYPPAPAPDSRILWATLTPRGTTHHYTTPGSQPQGKPPYTSPSKPSLPPPDPPISFDNTSFDSDSQTPLMESYQLNELVESDGTSDSSTLKKAQRPRVSSPTRIEHPNLPPLNLHPHRSIRRATLQRRESDAPTFSPPLQSASEPSGYIEAPAVGNLSQMSENKIQDDLNNIPLADDDPQVVIQEEAENVEHSNVTEAITRQRSLDSLPSSFTNGSSSPGPNSLDPDVSPDEQEEKARLISQVLELQNTLDDLSQRVDSVKEENLKLRSENQVLGQYIENLMSASSVFQSTSPKTKKK